MTGLDAVSLQPAAGSQGELTGLMLFRAYFADRGEDEQRTNIVIPDTAHGTNPASVTMAGYKLTPVRTDARGNIDVADLRTKVDEHTAGLMLTNPSTLGLFDETSRRSADLPRRRRPHVLRRREPERGASASRGPGDMGFDVMHINLHKTFSQPHGGGGPGAGPIAVRDILEPFLPVPVVATRRRHVPARLRPAQVDRQRARVLGHVRRVRPAYAYMRSYGPAQGDERGRRAERELHARAVERDLRPPVRAAVHARVRASARTLKREQGVSALDVAKRLIDYGYHPPTIYFPLVVPEALMIEPTETESKETLDAFCDALLAIAREAAEEPDTVHSAPHSRPVKRLDEVRAAKDVVVKYRFEDHPAELKLEAETGG